MFLKRLDIIGFKSFADKTTLEFSPGVTGVVGPNGSGKSNIADAIRWVLGEQSARSLRGAKMEDVIFAGTEKRRSINYCEVSLTLDNEDGHLSVPYHEVTVTRRVYRSGDSEYLINQQTCRLKDVHELFMDSGLGREAYSIIGQGRIEEMLSTRPEDRRGPFEDAAGIVKYKARRKESERRLEETSANLVRVDDILAELEHQAGPLEEEAKRATAYQLLADQFEALDIALLVQRIDDEMGKHRRALEDILVLRGEQVRAGEQVGLVERKLNEARAASEAVQSALESMNRQMLQAVEERERADGQIQLLQERLQNLEAVRRDRQEQLHRLDEETERLSTRKETLEERLQALRGRLEERKASLEVAAQTMNPDVRARLSEEVASCNSDLIESHQRAASLRNQIRSLEETLTNSAARTERLSLERTEREQTIRSIQGQVASTTEVLEGLRSTGLDLVDQMHQMTLKMREQTDQELEVRERLSRLQSERASLQSKHDLLKELEEGYDGFGHGVKSVLQAADGGRLTGVLGPLASLIRVDKRYELAIETALGAAMQNIVVSSERDGRAAIDFLKRRQAGRATFMPLDVLKSRRLSANDERRVANDVGFSGIASDLVASAPEYRAAVEHVLGNVVVTATLADANRLAKQLDYRVRIVTEEGDVVNPGGTMTGGTQSRRGPGLLGRQRELDELGQKLIENERQNSEVLANQTQLRGDIVRLSEEIKKTQERISEVQGEASTLEGKQRELVVMERNAKERLDSLQWDDATLMEEQTKSSTRLEEATRHLEACEAERRAIEVTLEQKRLAIDEWDKAQSVLQAELTEVKVNVAALEQEQVALVEQHAEIMHRIREAKDRRNQCVSDMEGTEQGIREATQGLETAEGLKVQLTETSATHEAQLAQLRFSRESSELEVRTLENEVRVAQNEVQQKQERLHRAEVAAERLDADLNHALGRLGDQYRMTYEWARDHSPKIDDVEASKREADKLKRQMDSLGNVQLGAIEEWDRLSGRVQFLTKERDDLREAELGLRSVIADIDDEMARRFLGAFELIRQEFEVAFRQLFQGGRADLELTNPEDVLQSGIEVIAQPPGKKLQNLNLMSGGERALTAMALLFAILRVRPVPFCVLDEVEAALDEANVSRFAEQLRRFATGTQFIVITHRRGTMEEVDSLYGVTMQEFGVSSLISVRLADDVDDASA